MENDRNGIDIKVDVWNIEQVESVIKALKTLPKTIDICCNIKIFDHLK